MGVKEEGLLTRILFALGLAMFCLIAFGTKAHATPVKPDIHQILAQPQTPPQPFPPARAGWKGPETPPSPKVAPNPMLETFGAAARKREIQRELLDAAIPDPRVVVIILTAILVLRRVRQESSPVAVSSSDGAEPMAA